MKNQLDQLVEAMIALARREDNIQWTVITKKVIPPQEKVSTQPRPVGTPVKDQDIQEYPIVRDGKLMMLLSIIVLHSLLQIPKG